MITSISHLEKQLYLFFSSHIFHVEIDLGENLPFFASFTSLLVFFLAFVVLEKCSRQALYALPLFLPSVSESEWKTCAVPNPLHSVPGG